MAARLRSMLPQSATGPLEDHDLMALEFKAQHFSHLRSHSELRGLVRELRHGADIPLRKAVLKLLQWKTPEKVWRLKSPTHTLFLQDYEKVFPDARFVQTHRDVAKVLPSVSDLYYTLLEVGNDVDPRDVGELNVTQWSVALQRMLAFRKDPVRDAESST